MSSDITRRWKVELRDSRGRIHFKYADARNGRDAAAIAKRAHQSSTVLGAEPMNEAYEPGGVSGDGPEALKDLFRI